MSLITTTHTRHALLLSTLLLSSSLLSPLAMASTELPGRGSAFNPCRAPCRKRRSRACWSAS